MSLKNADTLRPIFRKLSLILIVLILPGRLKAISSSQIYATEVLEDWSYLMKNSAWREKICFTSIKID